MTWTYTGDPSSSTTDEVRFLVGDTDAGSPLVQDEEIAYALSSEPSALRAAVRIARAIAATYARAVEKQVGDLKIKAGDRYKNYLELVKSLEAEAGIALPGALPYAGGISKADKLTQENDTDRTEPSFRKGMMDNPDTNSPETNRNLDD